MINYANRLDGAVITKQQVLSIFIRRAVLFERFEEPHRKMKTEERCDLMLLRAVCTAASLILGTSVVLVSISRNNWHTFDFCRMRRKIYVYVSEPTHAQVQTSMGSVMRFS